MEEVELREHTIHEREQQTQQLLQGLQRQRNRLQKRLDRVAGTQRQLSEDRGDIEVLRTDGDEDAGALDQAAAEAATAASAVQEQRKSLGRLSAEVGELREGIRSRQSELEHIQGDLQTKEADLDERRALLERGRAALEEREAQLNYASADATKANECREEANRSAEELERRLALLWDDIHQRQQVLEDIDTSLLGREERLRSEQHSLVCAHETTSSWHEGSSSWPIEVDSEQLSLELVAAELAERSWRERTTVLARRREELLARVHQLESTYANVGLAH